MTRKAKKKISKKVIKKVLAVSTVSSKPRINGAKKGKQFERDISTLLGHVFPAAERMLEYQASGNIGIDIQGTGNFKIQCKRNAGYAPISRINEIRSKDQNDIPVLVTKGNRMESMAVVPFDKFVYMLEVMHGLAPLLRKPEDNADKKIHSESGLLTAGMMHKINPPIIVSEDELKSLTKIGIQGKAKELHTVNSSSTNLLGLPVFQDNELSDMEITLVGSINENEAHRLLDLDLVTGNATGAIMALKEKLTVEGMIVRVIHCASIAALKSRIDIDGAISYPVETTKSISSLADLI